MSGISQAYKMSAAGMYKHIHFSCCSYWNMKLWEMLRHIIYQNELGLSWHSPGLGWWREVTQY